LTIIGYTEWYLICPKVAVFRNGEQIGEIPRNCIETFNISEDCEITFKCSFRKRKISVKINLKQKVQLHFNRTLGTLEARIIDEEDI